MSRGRQPRNRPSDYTWSVPPEPSQYHDDGQAAGLTQGGDAVYEAPVHGTDADGQEVTASFGRDDTSREGHTLIADGHRTSEEFYAEGGHDHHSPTGKPGDAGDRGAYSG